MFIYYTNLIARAQWSKLPAIPFKTFPFYQEFSTHQICQNQIKTNYKNFMNIFCHFRSGPLNNHGKGSSNVMCAGCSSPPSNLQMARTNSSAWAWNLLKFNQLAGCQQLFTSQLKVTMKIHTSFCFHFSFYKYFGFLSSLSSFVIFFCFCFYFKCQ